MHFQSTKPNQKENLQSWEQNLLTQYNILNQDLKEELQNYRKIASLPKVTEDLLKKQSGEVEQKVLQNVSFQKCNTTKKLSRSAVYTQMYKRA